MFVMPGFSNQTQPLEIETAFSFLFVFSHPRDMWYVIWFIIQRMYGIHLLLTQLTSGPIDWAQAKLSTFSFQNAKTCLIQPCCWQSQRASLSPCCSLVLPWTCPIRVMKAMKANKNGGLQQGIHVHGASGCDFNSGKKTISRVQAARTGAYTF